MDAGGGRKNGVWADFVWNAIFVSSYTVKALIPWSLERRDGLARGMYNRLAADDRFSSRASLDGAQFCVNSMFGRGGFSARQIVFGPCLADLSMWQSAKGDRDLAQDASISGQSVHQGKLRSLPQELSLKELAKRKLRRLLAPDRSFGCPDVEAGGL